ncbi:MAG: hypothetical protein H7X80_07975, partial [bacterium]|nr:hypothetical protein [Candidatus Kapabacteria bacterium]
TVLKGLKQGQIVEGFRATSLYLNDVGDAMGARFIHENTGFTLDLVRLQSVPQSFIWVNSWPTSDMGEPHTQEHLLLGKGNKGREVAGMEDAMLVGSSAFTMQWRTAYHFNTQAGPDAYFTVLERSLDAMLHPDYTDEEIRREVANFGVVDNPDGTLALEEKGTVYNEMVSSFERPWSRMARVLAQNVYGAKHPLTYVSGGLPEAIRRMKPDDIRRFHAATHHLANMGMVASFPKQIGVEEALRKVGTVLDRVEPGGGKTMRFTELRDIPAPKQTTTGSISVVDYPNSNAGQTGPVLMTWPAMLNLNSDDRLLVSLFLQSFAGDATTNLYKRLVDSRTRSIDVGAKSVFAWVDNDLGNPINIGLSDVDPAHMTTEGLAKIRGEVQSELKRISTLLDESPELIEINGRVLSRIAETRRSLSKFVNSPPRFGFRSSGSEWMEHLRGLEDVGGFAKSVTQREQLARVEAMIVGNNNIWRELIKKWHLIDHVPHIAAAKPSPALVEREAQERNARAATELARLRKTYNAANDQDAIKRYRADYDATTRELDSLAAISKTTRFIDNPPLTLDDELDYTESRLPSGVPLLTANFDDMTSATTGLAIRLDGVPADDLFYLSLLPEMLSQTGVVINGKPSPFEEMSEMLRYEVLGVNATFSASYSTGRVELMLTGAGNDAKEADRAIEWMGMMLMSPNWTAKNIGRLRDVVDQQLSSLRNTMQNREEAWVNDPASAYWRQDRPLLLTTSSFLTRSHNALRLKWLLKETGEPASRAAIDQWMQRLAGATATRRDDVRAMLKSIITRSGDVKQSKEHDEISAMSRSLNDEAHAIAVDAARDLEFALTEIPDNSLATDWQYLVNEMRTNLLVDPLEAVHRLDVVRRSLLKKSAARAYIVGSRATQEKLKVKLDMLINTFSDGPFVSTTYPSTRIIDSRVRERAKLSSDPLFVGLLNSSTSSGVILNSAPGTSYRDTTTEALLDFLSSMLYSGGAGHGVFMKTWAAGLAYSNGIRISPRSGRIGYYAERVPVLPQTLRFVIDELRKAQPDTALVDYAIAQAFQEARSASSFESRGEAMANDIADGLTPDVVRNFRRAILALRNHPDLARVLVDRMPSVLGRVLPGFGPKAATVNDGVFYVIGPNEQIKKYEEYLKSVEGTGTVVHELYPRDYWMVRTR